MRYICYKSTVSKMADQRLEKSEEIREILKVIKEHELTFSFRLKTGVLFEHTRIIDLTEDRFRYAVFSSSSILRKDSKYEDIEHLEVTIQDNVLAYLKPETMRWNLLEPADDIEEE